MNKRTVGKNGETIACGFLESHGYTVIEKNFRAKPGEIDIIAVKDEFIVFVEVKYRKNPAVSALYSVNKSKQRHIIKTALCYCALKPFYEKYQPRFDVLSISEEKESALSIDHIENAFRC